MNSIEFVKNYGIDEAKRVLSKNSTSKYFCKYLNTKPFTIKDTFSNNPDLDETAWVLVSDLKQIVEAFELVERFGGFDKSNKMLKKAYDNCSSIISIRKIGFECSYSDLQEAINLLEQCQ